MIHFTTESNSNSNVGPTDKGDNPNSTIGKLYSEMTLSGFPSSNVIEIGNSYLDNVR